MQPPARSPTVSAQNTARRWKAAKTLADFETEQSKRRPANIVHGALRNYKGDAKNDDMIMVSREPVHPGEFCARIICRSWG